LLRSLFVHDAARGAHPLQAGRAEIAFVDVVVFVFHPAGEHVGHRFEPTVRVRREAGNVVARLVGAELVEHQERIERARACRASNTRVSLTPAPSLVA
jgi:hypothetical protein